MKNKPDKKQIKKLVKQVKDIDVRLKAALDGEKEEIAHLRRTADIFLNAKFQAELESMDVEMLSQGKQNIRVSYLRSAGIQNVGQLSKMTRQQIQAVNGIGDQSAVKIYDLTKEIAKKHTEKAVFAHSDG